MPEPVVITAPPCTYEKVFRAHPDQVREARRFLAGIFTDCPVADDAILCLSELAGNAVIHSASNQPDGTFTVRAELLKDDYVRIEVHDNGGPWNGRNHGDGRPHGLDIVARLAAESGTCGDAVTGWISWAKLGWLGHASSPPDEPGRAEPWPPLPVPGDGCRCS